MSAHYKLAPDVIFIAAEDGSARLLDLGGSFFALSATGVHMLHELLDGGADAAVRAIVGRFQVESSQVETDVQRLIAQLKEARLITSGAPSAWRLRQVLADKIIALALRGPMKKSPSG